MTTRPIKSAVASDSATAASPSVSYTTRFYENQSGGSYRSARAVVEVLLKIYRPGSVVDIGCGVGTWLRAFTDNGISDVLGVDGDHVPRDLLQIPSDCFVTRDLRGSVDIERRFDLAMSTEVAEHLPQECAFLFVRALTQLAPVVLFSAAIPGQGGTGHVNEQWPGYWAELFGQLGFECFDFIRPEIWDSAEVEWWYRQNLLLFSANSQIFNMSTPPRGPRSIVHPVLYEFVRDRVKRPTLRELITSLPAAARASIAFRLQGATDRRRRSAREARGTP